MITQIEKSLDFSNISEISEIRGLIFNAFSQTEMKA
jgi:hypothetical protein